ncbi:MAG: hypothetical protein R3263_08865, partial [Myxococcota bacterium]|nr:hypothetical protein [Myxococcota bacterium]
MVLLALPATAAATPITYAFQSGTASVLVEVDGSEAGSASAPLDGSFFTFDAMVPEVVDLEYLVQESLDLDATLGTLTVDVLVEGGTDDVPGFSMPATDQGGGLFTYVGGPLELTAFVELSGGSIGFWDNGGNPIQVTIDDVDGSVQITGDTATVVTQKQF